MYHILYLYNKLKKRKYYKENYKKILYCTSLVDTASLASQLFTKGITCFSTILMLSFRWKTSERLLISLLDIKMKKISEKKSTFIYSYNNSCIDNEDEVNDCFKVA